MQSIVVMGEWVNDIKEDVVFLKWAIFRAKQTFIQTDYNKQSIWKAKKGGKFNFDILSIYIYVIKNI